MVKHDLPASNRASSGLESVGLGLFTLDAVREPMTNDIY